MSLFNELKRRNVFRVGIAYIVAAWLLMQIADVVLNNITAPEWVFQVIMLVLGLGFPLALIFAWAFEMTPEGIKKEREVDRSQSITSQTGRKLDFIIMGIMAVALAYFTWDKFGSDEGSEPISDQVTGQVAEPTEDVTSPLLANSIAVLPFANRSNVEDDLFFTDGIHDDLLTQLAKISGLKVISRTSVMEYRDTTKKIPEIAEELGVSSILEGGVQRAGKRIRINAQLIDVTTDEHLWAETFDREMTVENIFDIQSEITRQIVTAVRGELDESEAAALTQTPTSNLEAYEAYLHAKAQINLPDYIEQKFIDAETWAQRAVSLDPEFAQAWAILVETNCQLVWMGMDNAEERIQRASAALEKAILHGPALAETLAARAEYIYRVENDFHRAETAFAEAVKANPGDPRLLIRLGVAQRRAGAFEAAVSSFQLAIELDPANIEGRSLLVGTLNLMGEYRRAEPLIDLWIEKYPQARDIRANKTDVLVYQHGDLKAARAWFNGLEPAVSNAYLSIGAYLPILERDYQAAIDFWSKPLFSEFREHKARRIYIDSSFSRAYQLLGNDEKADEYAQSVIDLVDPQAIADPSHWDELLELAKVLAYQGEFDRALEYSGRVIKEFPIERDSINGAQYHSVYTAILAMAGRRDEALVEIERLLEVPAGMNRWELYLSPEWDFFRDDERFNELVRPLNLREDR